MADGNAIPVIVVTATKATLNSTLMNINDILHNGEVSRKIDCCEKIKVSMRQYSDTPKAFQKYEKALVKSKVFETMVGLIEKEDLNYLIDKQETCNLIIAILDCMMDTTDYLGDVGKSIAKAGGILYLTNICRFGSFIKKIGNENVRLLLLWSIATLHNIARLASVPQDFSINRTADAMVQFFGSKEEKLQVYAILTAVQIHDERQMDILIDNKNIIKSILTYLNEATKDKSHRYGGARIPELLDSIDKLAVADRNKKKILKGGALPIFLEVLKLNNSKEQAITSKILWTMSFDADVAKEITSNLELMEKLQSLSQSEEKTVKMNVQGFLYTLKKPDISKEHKPTHKNHVFISYSWKQQKVVLKLKNMLQKDGVKLWIDVEDMKGSTLESMAHAVENAAVVLICMSESYKDSPNCRLEASYAFKLQKKYIPLMVQTYYKPDGWLGALLEARLYINFSEKDQFQPKYNELLKELRFHIVLPDQHATNSTDATSVATHSTPADVMKWLTNIKLSKCCQHFENVNDEGLLQLQLMRHDAPEFYFKTLSEKLELNLGEILNLTAALAKI